MKDKLLHILKSGTTHKVAAFVAGAGVAAPVTYLVLTRKYEDKYAQLLDDEIQKTKEHYRILTKEGDASDPIQLAKNAGIASARKPVKVEASDPFDVFREKVEPYSPPESAPVDETDQATSVFELSMVDRAIIDRQAKMKDAGAPYPITQEDYFENGDSYEEVQVTYWLSDDMVTDIQEEQVFDQDKKIGQANLDLCQSLSADGSTCYVQNDKTRTIYEITIETGSFAHEVAGLGNDIVHSRHAGSRKHPRFHDGD